MNLKRQESGDTIVYLLEGRLDGITASGVEETFISQFDSGFKSYVFDMNLLEYISSAGLRTIVSCRNLAEKSQIDFRICNLTKTVYKVLEIAGFDSIFDLNLKFENGSIIENK